jgi:DNA-binding NarL/FixJ family response regulator
MVIAMSLPSQHLIAELKDLPIPQEPHPEKHGPERYSRRRFRVLLADNAPLILDTTRDYFESTEFDIIAVGSEQAARLLINFMSHALDAIVLDGRLTDDAAPEDRSGYELAVEMLDRLDYLPPIIIYSLYLSGEELERKGITFVLKDETDRIVEEVRAAIGRRRFRPQRRMSPGGAMPPVVILDDQGGGADLIRKELGRHDIDAETCADLTALLEAAPNLPSAMFILDVDGPERAERLEAIRRLKRLSEQTFYVVALVGREELKQEAAQAGPDVILVKDSVEADALDIVTRMAQHRMAMDRAAAEAAQRRLSQGRYKKLVTQLREVKESPERGMSAPAETVQQALNAAFLDPAEQFVLVSLHTQMLSAGGGAPDPATVDLCIEGASMLAAGDTSAADARAWLKRAQRYSPDFTLSWLDEEFYDDPDEDEDEEEDGD